MTDTLALLVSPGRPPGQELVAQSRGLRLDDLALLRAVANGLDPSAAAKRYRPDLASDLRVVRTHLLSVVREAQAHLSGLGESELAKALGAALRADLGVPEPASAQVDAQPTLEAFAQRFDVDMFSEQELVELYAEEFGAPAETALRQREPKSMDAALRGLDLVQLRCVQTPHGGDSASMWLSQRLCAQLQPFGVFRLADLVTFIIRLGRTWWRAVPGLGRGRAQRLVQWLRDHESYLGCALSARVAGGAAVATAVQPVHAALPMLRRDGVNALGAGTDAEAIQAWLCSLSLKSPNTLKAYRRDVERILLWARERGKGLTTLVLQDAVDHAQFLLDPPSHWVNPLPASRDMPDWRPMRGPLSVASANRALAAIGQGAHPLPCIPAHQLGARDPHGLPRCRGRHGGRGPDGHLVRLQLGHCQLRAIGGLGA